MFPSSEVFATLPPGTAKEISFAWLFYLVKTPDATVLIDTGFRDEALAKRFGITFVDPVAVLKKAGFAPESITDIIITHAHFDHIGSVDAFPNARIHIHTGAYKSFLDAPSMPHIASFLRENRNVFQFDSIYKLGYSITVYPVEGHAYGSCSVEILLPSGRIVLTGDEAYVDENVNQAIPVGSSVNPQANMEFLVQTKKSGVRFFTFHSPNVVGPGRTWKLIE